MKVKKSEDSDGVSDTVVCRVYVDVDDIMASVTVCRRCWVWRVSWASLNHEACLRPTLTALHRSSSHRPHPVVCQMTVRWNSLVTRGRWLRRRVWSVCRSLSTGNVYVNCRVNISFTSSVLTSGSRYVCCCCCGVMRTMMMMMTGDYTVLYWKLWTQAIASKSTSKFSQFFYTTNRLPVPL